MIIDNPKLNLSARELFLKEWKSEYPSASIGSNAGMLVFRGGDAYLERNGHPKFRLGGIFDFSSHANDNATHPLAVLNSGDWIECLGETQSDYLVVTSFRLLSPNRFVRGHGSDVKPIVRNWHRFLNKVRAFFVDKEFDELMTPTLVVCPGTEPFLEPFKTEFVKGRQKQVFYLPTSPELHLKKCLAKGWEKIFEIRPCFRNGELSSLHQPEFIMLEWYRALSTMEDLREDIRNLVCSLNPNFAAKRWSSRSIADLFREALEFELKPSTTKEDLEGLARAKGIDVSAAIDFDEAFFFLFVEAIEPLLKNYGCLYLHSYPPSQAALARLTSEGWGDRFEFYIDGIEIANAFNELNDPVIQRERALEDLAKKQRHGLTSITLDEEFFTCLEGGMPPSCGIALGLDRLFMVLNNLENINEFRLFPMREGDLG